MSTPKRNNRFVPIVISVSVVFGIIIGTFFANRFSGNRLNIINTSSNKLNDLLHIIDDSYVDTVNIADLEEAKSRNLEGWVFTLQAPSYGPFLTYSAKRELRKQMYMAYNTICTHDNENNNLDIVKQIVNHHREIAQLLGYKTYADYTLVKRMAQNSETVYNLLNQLLEAYKPTAKKEVEEVRKMAKANGN